MASFDKSHLGGFSVEYDTVIEIRDIISKSNKKDILEFGSGYGTNELLKIGQVYSIEDNIAWLNKTKSNYIHAPLEPREKIDPRFPKHKQYYSEKVLTKHLPPLKDKYGVVLVDGPLGTIGRSGILNYLNLLDVSVPFIFDDVNRGDELKLALSFSDVVKRSVVIKHGSSGKKYAIV